MQQYVYNGPQTATGMSKDILQSFILGHNFTKNSAGNNVRPQTIGEENDIISIDGKSSHSSVSEKSEVSTATPRRTDIDLGYEPEGSASPLPPYEKWKQSMYSMLHDREGFLAFKNFLSEINKAHILECWLAMKGFRDFDRPRSSENSSAASSTTGSLSNNQLPEEKIAKKLKLAKLIYRTYLQSSSQKPITSIKAATKQYIMKQIKVAVENPAVTELDSHLFVQAQTEIEHNVEATLYKPFLASDEFLKLSTQQDGSTPKMSSSLTQNVNMSQSPKNTEANEPSEAPITGSQIPYLPRLDENQVWSPAQRKQQSMAAAASASRISHNSDSLSSTNKNRSGTSVYSAAARNNEISDAFPYFTEGAPAYWVPPASAIGSDQASKSSDATSDTLSFTDNSSVDGAAYTASRQGQKRLMRNHIKKNPTNALPECPHVQRTSRMKDVPNLATKDPDAFFKLLEERLLEVLEQQRMKQKRVGAQFRVRQPPLSSDPLAFIKNEDEDMDELLESHVNRVIESPGGRHSPLRRNPSRPGMLRPPTTGVPVTHAGIGVVPGMAQNEVPDVATPVIPVNKTQMISAWIQTPQTQQSRLKKKGRGAVAVSEASSSGHYLHPAESTGLQSGATTTKKRQLLLQDPNMPLFDQPDAMTTIEEVKRRLMEETDDSCDYPAFNALTINSEPSAVAVGNAVPPSTSMNALPSTNPVTAQETAPREQGATDSDSSSETATLSNVNPSGDASQAKGEPDSTIVVYQMLHEPVPYKVTIPHNPLTLGQFKHAISRKGNYRYYFRQYSAELKRPVYFEVSNDYEILPRFDGYVLAKVDFVSA